MTLLTGQIVVRRLQSKSTGGVLPDRHRRLVAGKRLVLLTVAIFATGTVSELRPVRGLVALAATAPRTLLDLSRKRGHRMRAALFVTFSTLQSAVRGVQRKALVVLKTRHVDELMHLAMACFALAFHLALVRIIMAMLARLHLAHVALLPRRQRLLVGIWVTILARKRFMFAMQIKMVIAMLKAIGPGEAA
jgi:hypothetical protein